MQKAVIDTNILVSSLWSLYGNPAEIIRLILEGRIEPLFDKQIMDEYLDVLSRPKLAFQPETTNALLSNIKNYGIEVTVIDSVIPFTDESDRKFYDIAKTFNAILITGNTKHYPRDKLVKTPAQFLAEFNLKN